MEFILSPTGLYFGYTLGLTILHYHELHLWQLMLRSDLNDWELFSFMNLLERIRSYINWDQDDSRWWKMEKKGGGSFSVKSCF